MTPTLPRSIAAVLFDLDGTLVDSAPDLAGTANDMRVERKLPPLPYAELRAHAGSGARGMLGAAFGVMPDHPGYAAWCAEFHAGYAQRMLNDASLFGEVAAVLHALDRRAMPWGIVTNKAQRFAEPMCRALGLWPRAQVLVCGDTTPHTKPHPAPLLEAARRLNVSPRACVYIGDDLRDIQAGQGAGMYTGSAAWGYLGADSAPAAWNADFVLPNAGALLKWLELA